MKTISRGLAIATLVAAPSVALASTGPTPAPAPSRAAIVQTGDASAPVQEARRGRGADDRGGTHGRRGRGRDDGPNHTFLQDDGGTVQMARRGRGKDDGPGHDRGHRGRGRDDGPNHG